MPQDNNLPAPAPPPQPVIPALPSYDAQGVPQTREAVQALRNQRTELSNQLQSAVRRRSEIAEELENASAPERPGLEARLQQLDARILNIEAEIERTGQLIAQAPGQYLRGTTTAPNAPGGRQMNVDVTAIVAILSVFVLAPLAVSAARLLWKRAVNPSPPTFDRETAERLRRLEAGVDAIAIEVERISEAQRFVTKLMAEREKPKIEAGN